MNVETIPLSKLVPCPANVRKTGIKTGIDELAASIKAHGLLQNLQVRPTTDGRFEVVAGCRRLAALKLLAKQKHHAKTIGIACNILDAEDASEISLAENVVRLSMHPADQFDAFTALATAGHGIETIAGRFGITPATVRQRLKLASVSPRLIDLYRNEAMSLDQLMAFTVSDDRTAQEAAWFDQPDYNRDPDDIRRILTKAQVEASHPRVRFVGIDAYVAAGGLVVRDLFQPDHAGYLTDPALLDRLAVVKLETEAETLRSQGWAWVEIMPEIDWNTLHRFGRITPETLPLTEAETAERDQLATTYDALIEEHGDDPEPAIVAELEAIDARLDALSEGEAVWGEGEMERGGAIVSIGSDGLTRIERGLIHPEDKAAHAAGRRTEGDAASIPADITDPACRGLSDRMVADLTAQRTAALRVMLAGNPRVALAAMTHAMALTVFYSEHNGSCLGIRAASDDLRCSVDAIGDSPAAKVLTERLAVWQSVLPQEPGDLFGWLLAQPVEVVTGIMAFCAGMSVNAVRKPHERRGASHLAHADQLAEAVNLDMTQWWQPTAASYFGRVSKAAILEAVAEGCSPSAAENLVKLKKDALILRAEEKLTGTGWLPLLLRREAVGITTTVAADTAEMAEAA